MRCLLRDAGPSERYAGPCMRWYLITFASTPKMDEVRLQHTEHSSGKQGGVDDACRLLHSEEDVFTSSETAGVIDFTSS